MGAIPQNESPEAKTMGAIAQNESPEAKTMGAITQIESPEAKTMGAIAQNEPPEAKIPKWLLGTLWRLILSISGLCSRNGSQEASGSSF